MPPTWTCPNCLVRHVIGPALRWNTEISRCSHIKRNGDQCRIREWHSAGDNGMSHNPIHARVGIEARDIPA